MTDDLFDKILDRYGFIGAIVMILSLVVLVLGWFFVISFFPIAILAPVLIAAWMIWNVRGKKDA